MQLRTFGDSKVPTGTLRIVRTLEHLIDDGAGGLQFAAFVGYQKLGNPMKCTTF